jgi:DNA modification methylase
VKLLHGDCRAVLPTLEAGSVQTCVTSPPYWGLRDYGVEGQLGLEKTPEEYVSRMVEVFREVKRVLREDGTLWLNLGDSYAATTKGSGGKANSTLNAQRDDAGAVIGKSIVTFEPREFDLAACALKPKDLVGIPWRVAFALQADGWWLRSDVIWSKPNPMPESVTDRPTKAHEYLFLLTKAERYYYDAEAIKEPAAVSVVARAAYRNGGTKLAANANRHDGDKGQRTGFADYLDGRNRRSVWTIATQPFPEAHFAVMPEALVEPCILAGSKAGDTVLDPFAGSGTVGKVAARHGREFVGIELNPQYVGMARRRVAGPMFAEALA